MNYLLFDSQFAHTALLPLSFTRPVAALRVGILSIREKWEKYLNSPVSFYATDYLREKFPPTVANINTLIDGSLLPNKQLLHSITQLKNGQVLVQNKQVLAACATIDFVQENDMQSADLQQVEYKGEFQQITRPYHIFQQAEREIEADFKLITHGRKSAPISKTNQILAPENIFLEEGVTMEFATLNARNGFIYLGKNSEIMEGVLVRGSLALCEHATLKLGAKIYGATTIGVHSKVGGEVNNSVIQGFSNKGHDGFLGNSVLGEWCNIGADTNNSNLKNNYAEVRLWDYKTEGFARTGLQFCGLIMGDHSKCGINTMFNTGTVVGVNANIFGTGFPRNFIPSFAWGGASGFSLYAPKKAFEVAEKVMARRNIPFTEADRNLLNHIFEQTAKYRRF